MPIRALTIDFWNTLVVAHTNGARRQTLRMEHLLRCVRTLQPEATEAQVAAAYREAIRLFDDAWKQHHKTPPTAEIVGSIFALLELEVEAGLHAETVTRFEEGLLDGPPDFVEGVAEALAWAAGRYPIALISDTMFSPGRVIRRLLEQRGLYRYFDAFVFSDEAGFSKPDVRAFEQAATALGLAAAELAHVGDLRRTDVAGARHAGATALLFTGVHEDPEAGPEPDAYLRRWSDLPKIMSLLCS
jgi:putative hydrolase of the HAD superfamily